MPWTPRLRIVISDCLLVSTEFANRSDYIVQAIFYRPLLVGFTAFPPHWCHLESGSIKFETIGIIFALLILIGESNEMLSFKTSVRCFIVVIDGAKEPERTNRTIGCQVLSCAGQSCHIPGYIVLSCGLGANRKKDIYSYCPSGIAQHKIPSFGSTNTRL